jgi:histidinol phosphatase-like PHP family hydrolase
MAVEVNTDGWHTVSREAYPEPALLRACRERGIPTRINADAHALLRSTQPPAKPSVHEG